MLPRMLISPEPILRWAGKRECRLWRSLTQPRFTCFAVCCLIDAAHTAGLMLAIKLTIPEGTVVNAVSPAAVAGGNVETSQRIVDVLLRALAQALPARIPAASSGTMNNLTIGGIDPRTRSSPLHITKRSPAVWARGQIAMASPACTPI